MTEKEELDKITEDIIGAAIEVHKALGPGLLESAYEACLAFEVAERGRQVQQQVPLPLRYKGVRLDCGYRLDLWIDQKVVVEVKTVERVMPIYKAQLLSYLKLTGCKLGLILNFNVTVLKDGIVRLANNLPEQSQRTPRSQR